MANKWMFGSKNFYFAIEKIEKWATFRHFHTDRFAVVKITYYDLQIGRVGNTVHRTTLKSSYSV